MMTMLIKSSPLSEIYLARSAQTSVHDGWAMADHFGNVEDEDYALKQSSIITDWSHLIKYSLRGAQWCSLLEPLFPGVNTMTVNSCITDREFMLAKLMDDEYFILTSLLDLEQEILKLDINGASIINESGAQGCLAMAGPLRHETWLRSCAMNCAADVIPLHHCKPLSIHSIRSLFYRGSGFELLVVPRDTTAFMFDALMDVGDTARLTPTGLKIFPVQLS